MDQPNETPVSAPPPQTVASPDPNPVGAEAQAQTFLTEDGQGGGVGKYLKFALIPLVLLVLAFSVFKFLLPKLAKPKEVTLTYWGLWESESTMQTIAADYQKINPSVKINYVFSSPKDYRERLASSLAQGKGPDIFRFHNTWVPMLKNELVAVPAKVMDAAGFEAAYYPVARIDLRSGNNYLGLPLEIDGLGLFVNEEIFQTAGKSYPTTWDELRKTALDLTTKDASGKIQIAGAALGRTENVAHWSDILALMMLQNGVDLTNPQGSLAEDALTYFTLFTKVDKIWDETLPNSTQAFAAGKLAMYFGPSWEVFEIKKANPTLKFSVIPAPQLEGTNMTWASYWVEGVAKRSANQEAAWDFLKYLSSKETMQKLFQAQSQTRLFGEPYARTEMADLLKSDPYVGAFIKQAPAARSWYLCSRTFDNGLNDKMIKYFEDAVNAVNAEKTAKEALTTAAAGVAQVLSQYGISTSVVPR